jgi:hypothetical protein
MGHFSDISQPQVAANVNHKMRIAAIYARAAQSSSQRKGRLWFGSAELSADGASGEVVDFAMTRDRSLLAVGWVDPHRMPALFAQQFASVTAQVREQILAFHDATTPAGVSTMSLLTLKCK